MLYIYSCNTHNAFAVRAERRPTAPLCPTCAGSVDFICTAHDVAGLPVFNKPHSEWLRVVDDMTKRMYALMMNMVSDVNIQASARCIMTTTVTIDSERASYGLPPVREAFGPDPLAIHKMIDRLMTGCGVRPDDFTRGPRS